MANLVNEVLVSYDITDTKQRTILFNKLKDLSLIPIQKSVFWGHLNRAEENSIKRLLVAHCDKDDSAFISRIDLSSQILRGGGVGYQKEDFPKKPRSYYVL